MVAVRFGLASRVGADTEATGAPRPVVCVIEAVSPRSKRRNGIVLGVCPLGGRLTRDGLQQDGRSRAGPRRLTVPRSSSPAVYPRPSSGCEGCWDGLAVRVPAYENVVPSSTHLDGDGLGLAVTCPGGTRIPPRSLQASSETAESIERKCRTDRSRVAYERDADRTSSLRIIECQCRTERGVRVLRRGSVFGRHGYDRSFFPLQHRALGRRG